MRSLQVVGVAAGIAGVFVVACAQSAGGVGGADQEVDTTEAPREANGASPRGLPCDVAKTLSEKCATCHGATPASGASTSLVTWDDLQKDHGGTKLYELVAKKIHADTGRMPPAAVLSDAELAAIDGWIAGGAKASDATCNAADAPAAAQPLSCNAPGKPTMLRAATPFRWAEGGDADRYVCFGFDERVDAKRHAIAMAPLIDNASIVHHIILFQSPDPEPAEPHACGIVAAASWKIVTGWAPGGHNFELPPEAGFPVEGTTHWVMQVHYNNAKNAPGQSDNSGFQICETDALRPNDAGVLAFGAMFFTIPPRTERYTLRCDYALDDRYRGVTLFGAMPHMHRLGAGVATERLPGGNGAPQLVFGQTPFVFENQETKRIGPEHVAPGDVMRTRCTWKNPTDGAVGFGERTSDEMCFNFFAYYPAIPDEMMGAIPLQSWISPSLPLPLIGGPDCVEE